MSRGRAQLYHVEHGTGQPLLVLHGSGVDHREMQACIEPAVADVPGLRRIYPDLPGMGRSIAPDTLCSADDVVDVLLDFADEVTGGADFVVAGHSAGAQYARAMADRRPAQVCGLALLCPLLPGVRDLPDHRPVVADDQLGDQDFRGYFVVQTPEMLSRYERFVAPATALVDAAAMARIGERWEVTPTAGPPYPGPALIVAGRLDSTADYASATDLLSAFPRASLAVLDDAGHALPHEQPQVLRALVQEWVSRSRRHRSAGPLS